MKTITAFAAFALLSGTAFAQTVPQSGAAPATQPADPTSTTVEPSPAPAPDASATSPTGVEDPAGASEPTAAPEAATATDADPATQPHAGHKGKKKKH